MPSPPLSHPLALERLADAARSRPDVDVLGAAIAIATQHHPLIKPQAIEQTFDRIAGDVRHMLGFGNPPQATLHHVLFDRYGFSGNRDYYADPLNSYIDVVLQRRTGLPIMLSLVYVETARRAGLRAHGIGLPGHFIVALDPDGVAKGRVYLDPFSRGAVLSFEDCQRAALAAGVAWHDEFLEPVDGLSWTLRMLNNLRNVYGQRQGGDPANLAPVLEQILLLDPQNANRQADLQQAYLAIEQTRARNN